MNQRIANNSIHCTPVQQYNNKQIVIPSLLYFYYCCANGSLVSDSIHILSDWEHIWFYRYENQRKKIKTVEMIVSTPGLSPLIGQSQLQTHHRLCRHTIDYADTPQTLQIHHRLQRCQKLRHLTMSQTACKWLCWWNLFDLDLRVISLYPQTSFNICSCFKTL